MLMLTGTKEKCFGANVGDKQVRLQTFISKVPRCNSSVRWALPSLCSFVFGGVANCTWINKRVKMFQGHLKNMA